MKSRDLDKTVTCSQPLLSHLEDIRWPIWILRQKVLDAIPDSSAWASTFSENVFCKSQGQNPSVSFLLCWRSWDSSKFIALKFEKFWPQPQDVSAILSHNMAQLVIDVFGERSSAIFFPLLLSSRGGGAKWQSFVLGNKETSLALLSLACFLKAEASRHRKIVELLV